MTKASGDAQRRRLIHISLLMGLLALLTHGVILTDAGFRLQGIVGLIWCGLVPGILAVNLLFRDDRRLDIAERGVLSVGFGYASLVLGILILQALPGPLRRWHFLLFYDALVLFLLISFIGRSYQPTRLKTLDRALWVSLLLILLVAAFFRFPNLGYSEFHGDEARAVLRAAEMLQGNDEVILLHKKGPVEILLPAFLYAVGGRMNETMARFPFALTNLAAVGAMALLGRRLFRPRVGWLAAGLLAINGYCVALGRIAQYQSVVFLMAALSIFCYYRYYEEDDTGLAYPLTGALFAVVGLLSHYEGFLPLPIMAYLMWARGRRLEQGTKAVLRWALPPLFLISITLVGFYVPLLLHPHFERTLAYLTEKRIGGDIVYNNLLDFFLRSTVYNSTYYILWLILALVVAIVVQLRKAYASPPWRWVLPLSAVLCLAGIALCPIIWQVGSINLSVIAFLIVMGPLLFAPGLSDERRLLILWFAMPALLYFFLIGKVQSHYYLVFPAWVLIAALVLDEVIDRIRRASRRWARSMMLAAGIALYLICAYYIYLAFIQHDLEYIYTYPEHRSSLYWTAYGDKPPKGGLFGFPYRAGLKAVGGLYAAGVLQGEYISNQDDLVTQWYTRGQLRCPDADLYILSRDIFPHRIPPGLIDGEYMPAGRIWLNGRPQIWLWRRGYNGPVADYQFAEYVAEFDEVLSVPEFRTGAPMDEIVAPSHPLQVRLGSHFDLLGWDLERETVEPGDQVLLTLYWRARQPTAADYHVFVHVGDGFRVAQQDDVPCCGERPTYRWQTGEEVVDRYLLSIAADAPLGRYPIRVGMYDIADRQRLSIFDGDGQCLGTSLLLTHLRVGEPQFELLPIPHPRIVTLGDQVCFLGYDLSTRIVHSGEAVTLTLYWKALEEMSTSYTVFTHLLDVNGRIRGQNDSIPLEGRLPTTAWVVGEVIVDPYHIQISPDAPLGDCKLEIGLYNVKTGVRLTAVDDAGQRLPQDRILIEGLELAPNEE